MSNFVRPFVDGRRFGTRLGRWWACRWSLVTPGQVSIADIMKSLVSDRSHCRKSSTGEVAIRQGPVGDLHKVGCPIFDRFVIGSRTGAAW